LRLVVYRHQPVLATSPLRLTTSNFIIQLNTCGYSPYVTSFVTRGWVCRLQLLLALVSAVILRSESRHFTVSDSRLPQPGGPGPHIYIPREQGGPIISPSTGFPFRRVLGLSGLPCFTLSTAQQLFFEIFFASIKV
jgi:hypothetical protein